MKRQSKRETKQARNHYSAEFKAEAVRRSERDGVPVAARELKLHPSQLYAWRGKQRMTGQSSEDQRLIYAEQARLRREVARLEEENAFLKKAAAYFAKQPK
jgi:transposase